MADRMLTIDGIELPVITLADAHHAKAVYADQQRHTVEPGKGFTIGGATRCRVVTELPAPVGYTVTRSDLYDRHYLGEARDRRWVGYVPVGRPTWTAVVKGGPAAQSAAGPDRALKNVRAKQRKAEQ